MFVLEETVKLDIKALYYILLVALFVGVICLLNFVINPLIQGKIFVKEMYMRRDVDGAYRDAPISSPWHGHINKIKENLTELNKVGYEEVSISSFDNLKLVGYLFKQKTKSKGTIILVHGCHSHSLREWALFGNYYYKEGYNVLIIDQRAHNKSEGEYITFGVYEHKDLLQWIDYISENIGSKEKIYLHGISLGAAVVMMCADKVDSTKVKGIIADSGYINGREAFVKSIVGSMGNKKKIDATLKYVNKFSLKNYGFGIDEINPLECVKNTDIPMLFIIGSADTFGTHDTDTLYRQCSAQYKDIFIVNGATHGECFYRGEEEYKNRIKELMEVKK